VQPTAHQITGMGGRTREEMLNLLGKNKYGNDWNRPNLKVAVHAFIGKLADGKVATVQTLPWNMPAWGVGKGAKGSYNGSSIQFECCEDLLNSKTYFKQVYNEAVEFCVMLCKKYSIPIENIISHKEVHDQGYGSNHGDIDHWLKKFGYIMDDFRDEVNKKLNGSPTLPYKVRVTVDALNIRKGPGTEYEKVGKITDKGVYTIVEVKGNWGLLKSKQGWICLKGYTEKYKG
jgi:N-acetylmuramoyl-L-alanine amidase CwlA